VRKNYNKLTHTLPVNDLPYNIVPSEVRSFKAQCTMFFGQSLRDSTVKRYSLIVPEKYNLIVPLPCKTTVFLTVYHIFRTCSVQNHGFSGSDRESIGGLPGGLDCTLKCTKHVHVGCPFTVCIPMGDTRKGQNHSSQSKRVNFTVKLIRL
jgi:hypothetical protein